MELQNFLDERFVGIESGFTASRLSDSKAFYEASELTDDKERSATLLATFVCQAAIASMGPWNLPYPQRLNHLIRGAEPLLIRANGQFALLIFADGRVLGPTLVPLTVIPARFREYVPMNTEVWYRGIIQPARQFIEASGTKDGREAQRVLEIADIFYREHMLDECLNELTFMFVPRPETLLTCVPHPAWRVALGSSSSGPTAGILAKDSDNKRGVTTALHGLGGSSLPLGTAIYVDGTKCQLKATDALSDSCFIAIPNDLLPHHDGAHSGVLSGQTPGQGESVEFDRVGLGLKKTTVVGLDPFITIATNLSQKKLYTRADTQVGDSGTALVDAQDRVVGFSLERTGLAADIEFSAWVWADLVVKRLNITPI
jgi:hypothetical protein